MTVGHGRPLCHRLLGLRRQPASEYGTLRCGDGDYGRGDDRRRAFNVAYGHNLFGLRCWTSSPCA
jgi:hypothetical protein